MSELGKLLKRSKFASIAKPLGKATNPIHPTHQIVETRKAALDRQEWGLKYALPSKVKSRYVTFNNVDSQERMVDFETSAGDKWKRLRFQEMGLAPRLEKDGPNPLFRKRPKALDFEFSNLDFILGVDPNCSKKELEPLLSELRELRTEFREYLLKKNPKALSEKHFNIETFRNEGIEFLRVRRLKGNVNTLQSLKLSEQQKVHGFGGLSYNLKGRLSTHPNGIVQYNVTPGRMLTKNTVAAGGFVSKLQQSSSSSHWTKVTSEGEPREVVVPLRPQHAVFRPDGAVTLEFEAVTRTSKSDLRRPRKVVSQSNQAERLFKILSQND